METPKKKLTPKKDDILIIKQDFNLEYIDLFKGSRNQVTIKTEWIREGDYFEKLSMYNNSYSTVTTFGNTTLIK